MSRLLRIGGLAAALGLVLPRGGRAEDSLAYKYEFYREAEGRIAVKTQSALVTQDFGTDWEAKLSGTIDAIAGATPSGVPAPLNSDQVPLFTMHDRRKAWTADLSRPLGPVSLDAGFAYSRESDYTSYGWSLNSVTDFNEKNTSLTVGIAGTNDDVKVLIPGPPWQKKQGEDVIIGVSQLLSPNSTVTLDLTWGRATGFLSDQYKIVEKEVEVFTNIFLQEDFAENRPNQRNKASALLGWNQAFATLHGALDASYRYYGDTFGIRSHTANLAWVQRIGPQVILQPEFRIAHQSAAKFYYYALDNTSIVPVRVPNGTGPAYSSDYRLSALTTTNTGISLVYSPWNFLSVDAAFHYYTMRGTDGITPQSAYPRAKITTVGAKLSW